jgi:hypothetical protein
MFGSWLHRSRGRRAFATTPQPVGRDHGSAIPLRDLAQGTIYLYVAIDAFDDNEFHGRGDFGGYSGGTLEAPAHTVKEAKGFPFPQAAKVLTSPSAPSMTGAEGQPTFQLGYAAPPRWTSPPPFSPTSSCS